MMRHLNPAKSDISPVSIKKRFAFAWLQGLDYFKVAGKTGAFDHKMDALPGISPPAAPIFRAFAQYFPVVPPDTKWHAAC
ncbi:MAG: hypothetical protein ACOY4W_01085 [Thermodesulfobacteriota bacterium]